MKKSIFAWSLIGIATTTQAVPPHELTVDQTSEIISGTMSLPESNPDVVWTHMVPPPQTVKYSPERILELLKKPNVTIRAEEYGFPTDEMLQNQVEQRALPWGEGLIENISISYLVESPDLPKNETSPRIFFDFLHADSLHPLPPPSMKSARK